MNGPHCFGKAKGIGAHLDLFHDGATIRMFIFNGVFNSDDVISTARVDQVNKRRKGRSLSATCRTGEEDKTLTALGKWGQDGGKMERIERRDLRWKQADCGSQTTPLIMNVGSKSADIGAHETKIDGPNLVQFFSQRRGQ